MSERLRKVVFPVAGLGTRFLPASKVVAKEMLPVLDKPLIQYAVDEAVDAGADTLIFVTNRYKHAIADYFDVAYELARWQSSGDARLWKVILSPEFGDRIRLHRFTRDLDDYRSYITHSRGEFTVAKDQNVRLRSGWFSERSAQYLAAGKPVITQETGFSNVLPTGQGLFGFSSMSEVEEAVASINADYGRHGRAARALAREYFNYDVVLKRMLSEMGL